MRRYLLTEKQDAILGYVTHHPYASMREVAKAVGCTRETVQRAAVRLERMGLARAEAAARLGTKWETLDDELGGAP